MPALYTADSKPLTDAAGNHLKTGQTVTDVIFGDGIVRGTVPLTTSGGINVLIDWLGPKDQSKPKSRGAEFLTAKFAGRGVTVTSHTGADFESGRVHRHRDDEQPLGGELRGAIHASPERRRVANDSGVCSGEASPALSTRASVGHLSTSASPRDDRAAARTATREAVDDLEATLRKPWRGQASNVKAVQKKILEQFEERGVKRAELQDGVQINVAVTKYWVKWDGEDSAKETKMINITRLFQELLQSKRCPVEIKDELASELNNKAAKDYLKQRARAAPPVSSGSSKEAQELDHRMKQARTVGVAQALEKERQTQITKYVSLDPPLPDAQFSLCLYLLTVVVIMCHVPFSFVTNYYFRLFLRALRPNFEKMISEKWLRRTMAGPLLDELYEETIAITEEKLDSVPGLITLGIDGHKDGRGRSLETVTRAKLSISTFAGCEYMLTDRATGPRLAATVKSYMLKDVSKYVAIVADNTSANMTMFEELKAVAVLSQLFFLGCFIHVMDLLIEDIAKIEAYATLGKDAHAVIGFIKSHSILNEEFLALKTKLAIRSDLHLYPATRFAYLYLMLLSLYKTLPAVRLLIDSPVYKLCKDEAKKRGGDEGRKALAKFNTFEKVADDRSFKLKLDCGANTLMPLSIALHYLEGDKVPLSHVMMLYQTLYDYVQSLADELSVQDLLEEKDVERMIELVKERWLGTARKKGLKTDVHMLAFVLDPYAQAAATTPDEPVSDLISTTTLDGARAALRHHVREPALRALTSQQLQLWLAARPDLPPNAKEGDTAVAQGNNPYSSGFLAAMYIVWDRMEAREQSIESGEIKRPVPTGELGYDLAEAIARLKLTDLPTTFWLTMKSERPECASSEEFEAHKFFCKTALNVSAIVGHTCGVERAGKCYKVVLTSNRKSMKPEVMKKVAFVLSNYGLLHKGVEVGNAFADFSGSMFMDETDSEDLQDRRLHALRRGRLLTDEELLEDEPEDNEKGETSGEAAPEAEDEEGGDTLEAAAGRREIKWGVLPEGLTVAPKPGILDDSLINKFIYMRWETPHGWLLGIIKEMFTSATPRLFTKFNYRIQWFDGWVNHKLLLDNYNSGVSAPYNSWVLLEKLDVNELA